jgi:ABC-type Na+ efflux pump permease subunit
MLADTWIVMRKEFKELFVVYTHRPGTYILFALLAAIFGFILPLYIGPNWPQSLAMLVAAIGLPTLLISRMIADLVAGEQERHTLPALLATRLPFCALILGKLAAAALSVWATYLLSVILGLLTLTLIHSARAMHITPRLASSIFLISFSATVIAGYAGALIALRAQSVAHAQRTVNWLLLALISVAIIAYQLVINLLPESWYTRIANLFALATTLPVSIWVLLTLIFLTLLGLLFMRAARCLPFPNTGTHQSHSEQ